MSKELAPKEKTELQPAQEITPMTMLNMLVQQGAEPDKLAQMMELQERWEANNARKAYVSAMAKFRKGCPTIAKTLKAHNSSYAGLAETIEEIKDLMSKCGLSHSWKMEQTEGIKVTCCVTHELGHQECTSLSGPADTSGSKNSIQAIGSTVKYLERYTLFAILGLASKEFDDDGNGAGTPKITPEQANEIHAKITENGLNMDRFLKWLKTSLKCDSIEDINLNGYGVVISQINNSIKARSKK